MSGKRQNKIQASSSRAVSNSVNNAFPSKGLLDHGKSKTAASRISYLFEQPEYELSDPNIVICFKNLSKKDATTKLRALDDLQTHITSNTADNQVIEDSFIAIWITIFPRLSIDLDRRVRQNAHIVHGNICTASGKRIAKHMAYVVGPWSAGLFDPDRIAARAAQDAFRAVFQTQDKQSGVKKAYQEAILEYCIETLENESSKTLTDERSTSADDSEAMYCRVIATCMQAISDLLLVLPIDEKQKHMNQYDEVMNIKCIWNGASSDDVFVRTSVLQLWRGYLRTLPDVLLRRQDKMAKKIFSKAVAQNQRGSSLTFSALVLEITKGVSHFWESDALVEKESLMRLQILFKSGSQGGEAEFWTNLTSVVELVPRKALPSTQDDIRKLMATVRKGIAQRDEPKRNLGDAWTTYVALYQRIQETLDDIEARTLATELLLPIIHQFITKSSETTEWAIPAPHDLLISATIANSRRGTELLSSEWPTLTLEYVNALKLSAPTQSKAFDSSQMAVEAQGTRFLSLMSELWKTQHSEGLVNIFRDSLAKTIGASFELLQARDGKPYAAAGSVDSALRYLPNVFANDEKLKASLFQFLRSEIPQIVPVPSQTRLFCSLYRCADFTGFEELWTEIMAKLIKSSADHSSCAAIARFLSSPQIPADFSLAEKNCELQGFLTRQALKATENGQWAEFGQIFRSRASILAADTMDSILDDLIAKLSSKHEESSAITGMEAVFSAYSGRMQQILTGERGASILQSLIRLSDDPQTTSFERVSLLLDQINDMMALVGTNASTTSATTVLIRDELRGTSAQSLTLETLIELFVNSVEYARASFPESLLQVIPDSKECLLRIRKLLCGPVTINASIYDILGGSIYLVNIADSPGENLLNHHDSQGFSNVFRLASFITQLSKLNSGRGEQLPIETYAFLLLTAQLADNNISVRGSNDLFIYNNEETEDIVTGFIHDTHELLSPLVREWTTAKIDQRHLTAFDKIRHQMFANITDDSPSAYSHARMYAVLTSRIFAHHQPNALVDQYVAQTFTKLRKPSQTEILPLVAFIVGHRSILADTSEAARYVNELTSTLTGSKLEADESRVVRQLIIMNLMVHDQEHLIQSIAKQRRIFFVNHIVEWLNKTTNMYITSEICKVLVEFLPHISDVYGSQWASIIKALPNIWRQHGASETKTSALSNVSAKYTSLRLFSTIRRLAFYEDTNDDLKDAFDDGINDLSTSLIYLLTQMVQVSDEGDQPAKLMAELLAHQLAKFPPRELGNLEELYPCVRADSNAVQDAAFNILHKQIPKTTEKLSIDIAVEKRTGRLPEALLSLLMNNPNISDHFDLHLKRGIPLAISGFLRSWLLIFDHFKTSSEKLRLDYSEHVKEGDYIDGLLLIIFEFLGHTHGKPVDASQFDIITYSFGLQDLVLKDLQWLLVHIFYLCLKWLPSLTKNWWINTKSRQLRSLVETWTEKFISPLIVADTLASVTRWAEEQNSNADDGLAIKCNSKTSEITAIRVIDEQILSIAIRLPSNFPLGQATVHGLNRVAVPERKWQSWILNTQGVIAFSNGSIVDGLIAFRRNVNAQIKGQTECAICYSVVAQDRSLPTKKCGTCNNAFHGTCLFRWFKSSNSSSCPLCRTAFNYT